MVEPHKPALNVLLVEDNPGDARLAQEAWREGDVPCQLHHVTDGVEALAYLRRKSGFEEATRPDLILLDLNLPRKNGPEVLAEIKADLSLRRIPVVKRGWPPRSKSIRRARRSISFVCRPIGRGIAWFWSIRQIPSMSRRPTPC